MNEIMTQQNSTTSIAPFASLDAFAGAQRIATALAHSTIVPDSFRMKRWEGDNGQDGETAVANCLIALQLATRMQADPFMIMQNLYIVHGRPAFSAQFVIAAINTSGRFTPLQFKPFVKDGVVVGCQAYAKSKETGEMVAGPIVTMDMAQKEGWTNKSGSKWKTMPEVMLRYRAASFFGRLYAPDVMMGMQTSEELEDAAVAQPIENPAPRKEVNQEEPGESTSAVADLNALLSAPVIKEDVTVVENETPAQTSQNAQEQGKVVEGDQVSIDDVLNESDLNLVAQE